MKKLMTSTILTVAAVPFLMAAPNAVKKAQDQPAPTKAHVTKNAHKSHGKKSKNKAANTVTQK